MSSAIRNIGKAILRQAGFHTTRKIVVFESDDWGSIRSSSAEAVQRYSERFPDHELNHYQALDGLESSDDIQALYDVLVHAPFDNAPARFTLNFAMANPVFSDKVREQGIEAFAFEPITETYKRYFPENNPLALLCDEAYAAVLKPQLHGREHLNATQWFQGVQTDERIAFGFDLHMIGLDNTRPYDAMDALSRTNSAIDRMQYLQDAQALFQETFGFASESYIPPCYVVDNECLKMLAEIGVRTIQGSVVMNITHANGTLKPRVNYTGKRNKYNQIHLARNCYFEPAKYFHKHLSAQACIDDTLASIQQAFDARQVAIVCTHRVNYTSAIHSACRDNSLEALQSLLFHLAKTYPDIEFMTSDEVGNLMRW